MLPPVIAIFDIGKTNKKLLLFDEQYKLVYEESKQLEQINDEDGFAGEDVQALTQWVNGSFARLLKEQQSEIKAVNFAAYGASFVYLDEQMQVFLPLYNYLKPCSPVLQKKFYHDYGGESLVARQTASPVLGNLNSGMQLYQMKHEKPVVFERVKWALHLPQYLSWLLSSSVHSDITSIGCHTLLWDFQHHDYHSWVKAEGIEKKLPRMIGCGEIAGYSENQITVGVGLHDSSAALIPFLASFNEPFILLSTGTWCISLNPFNHARLTNNELNQDCLCYLSYEGKRVKASRLFAGNEHEQETKKLSTYFKKAPDYYKTVLCDFQILHTIKPLKDLSGKEVNPAMIRSSAFPARELTLFASFEEAYHQLIADIIVLQKHSTDLVLKGTGVKRIFVDGGFSNNPIYMNLLAEAFPGIEVYAAAVPRASALGAALVIHRHWNSQPLPSDIIELKYYAPDRKTIKN
jgi:sugar (pentulose or hexulose) kinase